MPGLLMPRPAYLQRFGVVVAPAGPARTFDDAAGQRKGKGEQQECCDSAFHDLSPLSQSGANAARSHEVAVTLGNAACGRGADWHLSTEPG